MEHDPAVSLCVRRKKRWRAVVVVQTCAYLARIAGISETDLGRNRSLARAESGAFSPSSSPGWSFTNVGRSNFPSRYVTLCFGPRSYPKSGSTTAWVRRDRPPLAIATSKLTDAQAERMSVVTRLFQLSVEAPDGCDARIRSHQSSTPGDAGWLAGCWRRVGFLVSEELREIWRNPPRPANRGFLQEWADDMDRHAAALLPALVLPCARWKDYHPRTYT